MTEVCCCCMDHPATLQIFPCTHKVICGTCFTQFLQEKSTYNKCPLCRTSIEEYRATDSNFTFHVSDIADEMEDDEEMDEEYLPSLSEEEDLEPLTLEEAEQKQWEEMLNFEEEGEEDYVPEGEESDLSDEESDLSDEESDVSDGAESEQK